jgi:hypothetical protein
MPEVTTIGLGLGTASMAGTSWVRRIPRSLDGMKFGAGCLSRWLASMGPGFSWVTGFAEPSLSP